MTVGQLAKAVNGRVLRGALQSRLLHGVRDLAHAQPGDATFCTAPRYRALVSTTKATAVLVDASLAAALPDALQDGTFIVCDDPYLALSRAAQLFAPKQQQAGTRHPSAVIDKSADVADDVTVGPLCVIEAGARIAQGCVLEAQSFVGKDTHIGKQSKVGVGTKVMWGCIVGEHVTLQPGAVIGSDGFGFAVDPATGARYPIPQLGNVVLGDHVDIGSHACIDRATFGSTTIGRGSKIDNLVQVAHNCHIGEDCVMTAQTGVAGSTTLGARVLVGAQAGIAGHLDIASDVQLAARAGVPSSISSKGRYGGTPTQSLHDWRRSMAALRRLPEAFKRLARLEAHPLFSNERPAEEPS